MYGLLGVCFLISISTQLENQASGRKKVLLLLTCPFLDWLLATLATAGLEFRFRAVHCSWECPFQVQATSCDERFRHQNRPRHHDTSWYIMTMWRQCVKLCVDFQVGFSPLGKEASERLRSTAEMFSVFSRSLLFLFVQFILSRFCTRAVPWQGLYFQKCHSRFTAVLPVLHEQCLKLDCFAGKQHLRVAVC